MNHLQKKWQCTSINRLLSLLEIYVKEEKKSAMCVSSPVAIFPLNCQLLVEVVMTALQLINVGGYRVELAQNWWICPDFTHIALMWKSAGDRSDSDIEIFLLDCIRSTIVFSIPRWQCSLGDSFISAVSGAYQRRMPTGWRLSCATSQSTICSLQQKHDHKHGFCQGLSRERHWSLVWGWLGHVQWYGCSNNW